MPDSGEALKPKPDSPRQPEKAAPKPTEGQKPKDATGTQRAIDALNITTPGVPDRADLQNLAHAGQSKETNIISGTLSEGMDLDPRYQAVKNELKQKWLAEHPGQDFLTEQGQNYNLGHLDPKDRGKPTLKSDSDRLFREKYADDAKAYDQKEKSRVYEDPKQDPAIRQTEDAITKATNQDRQVQNVRRASGLDGYGATWDRVFTRETIQGWDRFVSQYPDKARAYADKGHVQLQRALESRERRKQEQEQGQRVEASSRPPTNEQGPADSQSTAEDKRHYVVFEDDHLRGSRNRSDEQAATSTPQNTGEQTQAGSSDGKEKQNDYEFARLAGKVFSRYMDAENPVIQNNVTSEMQDSLSALAFEARKDNATPENVAPAMAFLLDKMADANPDYVDPVIVLAYEIQGMDHKDAYRQARELFISAGKKLWPDIQVPPGEGNIVRLRNAVLSLRDEHEAPGLLAAGNYYGKLESPIYGKNTNPDEKRYVYARLMNAIGQSVKLNYLDDLLDGKDTPMTSKQVAGVVRSAYTIELHKDTIK